MSTLSYRFLKSDETRLSRRLDDIFLVVVVSNNKLRNHKNKQIKKWETFCNGVGFCCSARVRRRRREEEDEEEGSVVYIRRVDNRLCLLKALLLPPLCCFVAKELKKKKKRRNIFGF